MYDPIIWKFHNFDAASDDLYQRIPQVILDYGKMLLSELL